MPSGGLGCATQSTARHRSGMKEWSCREGDALFPSELDALDALPCPPHPCRRPPTGGHSGHSARPERRGVRPHSHPRFRQPQPRSPPDVATAGQRAAVRPGGLGAPERAADRRDRRRRESSDSQQDLLRRRGEFAAFVTVLDALRLASLPYYPASLELQTYNPAYRPDSSRGILRAVDDRERNMFVEIFEETLLPDLR